MVHGSSPLISSRPILAERGDPAYPRIFLGGWLRISERRRHSRARRYPALSSTIRELHRYPKHRGGGTFVGSIEPQGI